MVLLATASVAAPPPCGYEVEILPEIHCPGPLPDFSVTAKAVNAAGVVTGQYQNHCAISGPMPFEGFTWTPQTGIVTIPRPREVTSLQPADISDSGLIVGTHSVKGNDLGFLGFLYDGQRLINLGTLPGGTNSQAYGVNSTGTVVGWWGNIVTGIPTAGSAFIWQDDIMHDLGPDLGGAEGRANDVNDRNVVTGFLYKESGDKAAFIWDSGSVVILPPTPGGFTSEGVAISDDGWVAGHGLVEVAPGHIVLHPFVWDGTRMISIDHLPGVTSSRVTGMTNDHQAIGYGVEGTITGSQTGAFLWSQGVTYDIGDFIKRNGYVLTKPWGINDHGDIAMTGAFDGRGISAVIRPVGQRLADLNCDGSVGSADLQMLLSAWGTCDVPSCVADLDDNRIVNGFDLAILLASWG